MSPQEYLEIERKAEFKSEYYNGKMSAIPRNNAQHAIIISNLIGELGMQLKKRPELMYSGLRLRVLPSGLYTYPDLMVVRAEQQFDDDQKDTLLNPILILEVMSEATLN